MESTQLLGQEWHTLQNNHEQHEKNALLIKLTCLALCLAGLATAVPLAWIGALVLLCWVQEGIFKTYQTRLGDRLMRVESLLRSGPQPGQAMQLHSEWLAARAHGTGLLAGYVASACKPTVAFPYLPVLVLGWLADLLQWV